VIRTCGHCGEPCGDYAGGSASISHAGGPVIPLCHPNDPSRPDCYRRVTVYREELGALRGVHPKPPGLIGVAEDAAWRAMVAFGEELGT
jgi:hypothetical protein